MLARHGYRVVASTGDKGARQYLERLGAREILARDVLAAPSDRSLESGRWAGAVDSVGGSTLAGLLRAMAQGASVAACGNAAGNELHTTVLPFILRGVSLLGIDSNYCPLERRRAAWNRLARELPAEVLDSIGRAAALSDLPRLAEEILRGQVQGRVVIDVGR
jgi:acrylyl-CoA reductase (NADPH)